MVFATACVEAPTTTTLAELGPVELEITFHYYFVDLEVAYEGACATLGDDFYVELAGERGPPPFPGGWVETCTAPRMSPPCTPGPDVCRRPSVGAYTFDDIGELLTFGDASRTITCSIGDAGRPRSITRVPDVPWTGNRPGDRNTVRWSHPADLQRLPLSVTLIHQWKPLWDLPPEVKTEAVPFTISGDEITFDLPATYDIWSTSYTVRFEVRGALDSTKGCGGTRNRRNYRYLVDVDLLRY